MEQTFSTRRLRTLFCLGLLGCVLMAGSDWLMIYGDTAYEGTLNWLTVGVAQIEPWRNALALLLAFPAVLCYAAALFAVGAFLPEKRARKRYGGLTALGLTPWLALHLFYLMIFFLFAFLQQQGLKELSFTACEALFRQFMFLLPLAQVIMALPFLYLLWLVFSRQTVLPRWTAFNNPIVLLYLLKMATGLMPDTPFRLAFTNGLMSEAMFLWFILLTVSVSYLKKE